MTTTLIADTSASDLADNWTTGLDPETVSFCQDAAARITARGRGVVTDMIAMGVDLRNVKAKLTHGRWLSWLAQYFPQSERQAQTCMTMAERFADKSAEVADFPLDTVRLLAARSTPEHVRADVFSGTTPPTMKAVRAAIAQAKGTTAPRTQQDAPVEPTAQGNTTGDLMASFSEIETNDVLAELSSRPSDELVAACSLAAAYPGSREALQRLHDAIAKALSTT